MGKLTLILGGARSGKSSYAQKLARERGEKITYIATARALDPEMQSRIHNHRRERPESWRTVEAPRWIAKTLEKEPFNADVVILDCMTLLVSNIMLSYLPTEISEPSPENLDNETQVDEDLVTRDVDNEVAALVEWIDRHDAEWIIVSNEVGLGLVPPYPLGRVYRDVLGRANKHLAAVANEVYLLVAGLPLPLHLMTGGGTITGHLSD